MVRKVAAALVGLGLIGGAGKVAYDKNGGATVKITDENGQVQTVHIAGDGKGYSCPSSTADKVDSAAVEVGRIELTLQQVRRVERRIERQYPKSVAPHSVVVRYNALLRRDHRLVVAYNAEVDAHNAILDQKCKAQ
jgi:hypothetical protein